LGLLHDKISYKQLLVHRGASSSAVFHESLLPPIETVPPDGLEKLFLAREKKLCQCTLAPTVNIGHLHWQKNGQLLPQKCRHPTTGGPTSHLLLDLCSDLSIALVDSSGDPVSCPIVQYLVHPDQCFRLLLR
jgi:hypothetical protein